MPGSPVSQPVFRCPHLPLQVSRALPIPLGKDYSQALFTYFLFFLPSTQGQVMSTILCAHVC